MDAFDEMRGPNGSLAGPYQAIADWLYATPPQLLDDKRHEAEILFRRIGITFNVYGEEAGAERLIPFDIIPRVLSQDEWVRLSKGLEQRVRALDAFLADVYHEQEILKAGKVPVRKVMGNALYRPEMQGIEVPGGVYVQIAGIDIVRTDPQRFFVLEDNLRTPSGVSYMLEDRAVMMRLFPDLFSKAKVAPVNHYPHELLRTLRSVAPTHAGSDPVVALLTPGPYNSAYFEHAFLAEEMGIELVEGQDLFVQDDAVYMRTTMGPKRIDVIYRRLDDEFIDPLAFSPDSMLGVPGLLSVYRNGNVTLANALGTGIADDKSIYPYVPDMVRFYLGEEPILENVPTWLLERPEDLAYALDHLPELVVKETQGSGGYGMLVGPKSTKEEIAQFRQKIVANPAGYIAQPTLALSTCPTFADEGIAPRHVDLRPFVLHGRNSITTVPGGLTRVALRKGSLVVNSSQGGGTKDTWVLEE